MPFSSEEQAVIAHKYLLQLVRHIRRPVSVSKQLIGNVSLRIPRDAAICKALAREFYDSDMGARSLESAVKVRVEAPLVQRYLEANETIKENQSLEVYSVDLDTSCQIVITQSI